jgi:hypothetical protein
MPNRGSRCSPFLSRHDGLTDPRLISGATYPWNFASELREFGGRRPRRLHGPVQHPPGTSPRTRRALAPRHRRPSPGTWRNNPDSPAAFTLARRFTNTLSKAAQQPVRVSAGGAAAPGGRSGQVTPPRSSAPRSILTSPPPSGASSSNARVHRLRLLQRRLSRLPFLASLAQHLRKSTGCRRHLRARGAAIGDAQPSCSALVPAEGCHWHHASRASDGRKAPGLHSRTLHDVSSDGTGGCGTR